MVAASAAAAARDRSAAVTLSPINWAEAAASLADHGIEPPAVEFARLNAQVGKRFAGIDKSSVPVLLPIDIDRFRADVAAGKPDAATSDKYFGRIPSVASFSCRARPATSATFLLNNGDGGLEFTFRKAGRDRDHRRGLHLRSRRRRTTRKLFPAPRSSRRLSRHQAHPARSACALRVRALRRALCRLDPVLRPPAGARAICRARKPIRSRCASCVCCSTAGGSPLPIEDAAHRSRRGRRRNRRISPITARAISFPNTGWRKMPGRADYHVYADMRFPIANAPAYVKSQSFMPWGDCYKSGTRGPARQEGRALFLPA